MSLQTEFLEFNKRIKVDYDTKSELAEKRDILVGILRGSDELNGFKIRNQGSYGMCTGVEPVGDKEYDIDVALEFNCNKDDFGPLDYKKIICDILKNHTHYGAKIKKPCVTVTYMKDGEKAYHVDLVVYMYEDKDDESSQLYLAKGIEGNPDETYWEKSDPKGLIEYINDSVNKENKEQFRRIVRYFKRWKNLRFSSAGHAEPSSIGITLIVADNFTPYTNNDGYDDLNALISIANKMKSLFQFVGYNSDNNRALYRIKYYLPFTLKFEMLTDVFEKMTDIQMTDFKDKLEKFVSDLEAVVSEADENEQYKKLNKIFGDDFHVPDMTVTAKYQKNYIPSSSSSGNSNE